MDAQRACARANAFYTHGVCQDAADEEDAMSILSICFAVAVAGVSWPENMVLSQEVASAPHTLSSLHRTAALGLVLLDTSRSFFP